MKIYSTYRALSITIPAAVFALLLLVSCLNANSGNRNFKSAEGTAWNTLWHLTYKSDKDLNDSVNAIIESVDLALSVFNDSSEVSRINKSDDKLKVSRMLREVYCLSEKIWLISGGMFDPTLSPAITAWGFGRGHAVTPDTTALDSLADFIGFRHTRLIKDTIYKDNPRVEFNFSAVAKGYGVDCIAEMLERNGVRDYLIEVGGEIRASGNGPSGNKWRIAVECPEENSSNSPGPSPDDRHLREGDVNQTILLSGSGLATSGNYRNIQKISNGKTVSHTLSPFTLRPLETDIASATVIAPTCAEADALATASMALGSHKAIHLLDSLHLPALFILSDMTIVKNRYME